jgi:cyclomaltodextrinase / maltogenic alpha-amylase / neopullulanase
LATLLLLTFPGAVSIYYGDEVGLAGAIDPDSRRGFPSKSDWDQKLLTYHRQLIFLRHAYPALRIGTYRVLHAQGNAYAFVRSLDDEELVVVVNSGTESLDLVLELSSLGLKSKPVQLLFGTAQVELKQTEAIAHLSIALPARSGCVLGE